MADPIHRHPEMEHFNNLNTILHSLVDFIRPETFIARDELETYNELKEKFLRESTAKRTGQAAKSPLEIAGVQSIRTTSGIYRFLAHHHSMPLSCPFIFDFVQFRIHSSSSEYQTKIQHTCQSTRIIEKTSRENAASSTTRRLSSLIF